MPVELSLIAFEVSFPPSLSLFFGGEGRFLFFFFCLVVYVRVFERLLNFLLLSAVFCFINSSLFYLFFYIASVPSYFIYSFLIRLFHLLLNILPNYSLLFYSIFSASLSLSSLFHLSFISLHILSIYSLLFPFFSSVSSSRLIYHIFSYIFFLTILSYFILSSCTFLLSLLLMVTDTLLS